MSTDNETIDAAWKAAEDALPEGGRLAIQRRPESGPYEAWAQSAERVSLGFAYADTPVAALRKLTARLTNDAPANASDRLIEARRLIDDGQIGRALDTLAGPPSDD